MKSLITEFKKVILKKLNPKIEDIIIFGSYMRGKDEPQDIDIMIIFKKDIDKEIEYEIKKELQKIDKRIEIISKTKNQVIEESFDARESFLFEGYSLINNKKISEEYGFENLGCFRYDIKNLDNNQRTKFYYALNGRKTEGYLKRVEGKKFSDNVIIVPIEKIEETNDFFRLWKIDFLYTPLLLPQRIWRVI